MAKITKGDLDLLKARCDALTGLELRAGLVVVRQSVRSDGGTRVIATFENIDTARIFHDLSVALPDLIEMAYASLDQPATT